MRNQLLSSAFSKIQREDYVYYEHKRHQDSVLWQQNVGICVGVALYFEASLITDRGVGERKRRTEISVEESFEREFLLG